MPGEVESRPDYRAMWKQAIENYQEALARAEAASFHWPGGRYWECRGRYLPASPLLYQPLPPPPELEGG